MSFGDVLVEWIEERGKTRRARIEARSERKETRRKEKTKRVEARQEGKTERKEEKYAYKRYRQDKMTERKANRTKAWSSAVGQVAGGLFGGGEPAYTPAPAADSTPLFLGLGLAGLGFVAVLASQRSSAPGRAQPSILLLPSPGKRR